MGEVHITPRQVTRESIVRFAELTDDFSRIHMDRDYALSLGLRDNFAHGLLGASWATAWLSKVHQSRGHKNEMPIAIEFNFGTPVFCNDELSLQYQPLDSGENTSQTGFAFSLKNQDEQIASNGQVNFASAATLQNHPQVSKIQPTEFTPDNEKVYFAKDMYEDGPRGVCAIREFSANAVADYIHYTGEQAVVYQDEHGSYPWVPPVLVFCQAFAAWLKAFTAVKTPDESFPGHIKDTFQQHLPIAVSDSLGIIHQVTAYRDSSSRPGMALITITIQVINQRDEVVQSASVLLMMSANARVS